MFKVFLLFSEIYFSLFSILFFLAFLVHKTFCNLPSKDFHMQTVMGGGECWQGRERGDSLRRCLRVVTDAL